MISQICTVKTADGKSYNNMTAASSMQDSVLVLLREIMISVNLSGRCGWKITYGQVAVLSLHLPLGSHRVFGT